MADDGRDERPPEDAFASRQVDRHRVLDAIRRLEDAVGMASGGGGWLDEVASDLELLESAMREDQRASRRPDALLPLIEAENPRRFGPRVRHLREEGEDLVRRLSSLRARMEPSSYVVDPIDLRHRVGWIVRALHEHLARQTDLVYEAIEKDLGER